jgi:hypothetical protein
MFSISKVSVIDVDEITLLTATKGEEFATAFSSLKGNLVTMGMSEKSDEIRKCPAVT